MTLTKPRTTKKETNDIPVFKPNQFEEKLLTWISLIQTKNRRRMTQYEQCRYAELLSDKAFQKQLTHRSRI